jgi:hypothetical protein
MTLLPLCEVCGKPATTSVFMPDKTAPGEWGGLFSKATGALRHFCDEHKRAPPEFEDERNP